MLGRSVNRRFGASVASVCAALLSLAGGRSRGRPCDWRPSRSGGGCDPGDPAQRLARDRPARSGQQDGPGLRAGEGNQDLEAAGDKEGVADVLGGLFAFGTTPLDRRRLKAAIARAAGAPDVALWRLGTQDRRLWNEVP